MSSLLSDVLIKLARSVGLAAAPTSTLEVGFIERTPEDVKRALAAARRIRTQAKKMKLGVTDDEILRWTKEGRR